MPWWLPWERCTFLSIPANILGDSVLNVITGEMTVRPKNRLTAGMHRTAMLFPEFQRKGLTRTVFLDEILPQRGQRTANQNKFNRSFNCINL